MKGRWKYFSTEDRILCPSTPLFFEKVVTIYAPLIQLSNIVANMISLNVGDVRSFSASLSAICNTSYYMLTDKRSATDFLCKRF